jgi:hypothetical protein
MVACWENFSNISHYWTTEQGQAKIKVKQLAKTLKKKRSEIRLDIIAQYKRTFSDESVPPALQNYLTAKDRMRDALGELETKKAEARKIAASKIVTTPSGKQKDPTKEDIDAYIKTDKDVQDAIEEVNLVTKDIELYEAQGRQNIKTKEPTREDIDAKIDMEPVIVQLEEALLAAEIEKIKYDSAVDQVGDLKHALDALLTLWVKNYWSDPRILPGATTTEESNEIEREKRERLNK